MWNRLRRRVSKSWGKLEVKKSEVDQVLKVGGRDIEAARLLLVGEIGAQISVQIGDNRVVYDSLRQSFMVALLIQRGRS